MSIFVYIIKIMGNVNVKPIDTVFKSSQVSNNVESKVDKSSQDSNNVESKVETIIPVVESKNETIIPVVESKNETNIHVVESKNETNIPVVEPEIETIIPNFESKIETILTPNVHEQILMNREFDPIVHEFDAVIQCTNELLNKVELNIPDSDDDDDMPDLVPVSDSDDDMPNLVPDSDEECDVPVNDTIVNAIDSDNIAADTEPVIYEPETAATAATTPNDVIIEDVD